MELKAFSSDLSKGLGEQIVKHRKKRRITQAQLSKLIDISVDTLSSYENGRVSIPFDKMLLMATVLGIENIHFHVKPYKVPILNDVTFHVDMGICEEIKQALETKPVEMRKPLVYSMIRQMIPYIQGDELGTEILGLYLKYSRELKDKDGKPITDGAYEEWTPTIEENTDTFLKLNIYPRPYKPSDMQEGSVKVSTE